MLMSILRHRLFHPVEEVHRVWTNKILAARAILLALPTRMAPLVMCAKNIGEVEKFAREEVYRALNELADRSKGNQEAG